MGDKYSYSLDSVFHKCLPFTNDLSWNATQIKVEMSSKGDTSNTRKGNNCKIANINQRGGSSTTICVYYWSLDRVDM